MLLSDEQVTLLAAGLGVVGQSPEEMKRQMTERFPQKIRYWIDSVRQLGTPVQACTWNMVLRRRYV